ncbi:MAG: hypothetical protein OSJ74_03720, partial [Clostridia bacterium]|nr:hypothetical protein [Clostridia bacterium]
VYTFFGNAKYVDILQIKTEVCMEKEKKIISGGEATDRKLKLEVEVPEKEELVVCTLCGHKNSKNAGLCVMCSNYLF